MAGRGRPQFAALCPHPHAHSRGQQAGQPRSIPRRLEDGHFNSLPDPEARLEFYQHDQHWSNRIILGDSLQVVSSLAEREGLRGKVQCIYFDPPYGIKFNSNWQVSTQSCDVKDGKQTDISREPEQMKAFRDTWKDGIAAALRIDLCLDGLDLCREGPLWLRQSEPEHHDIGRSLRIGISRNARAILRFYLRDSPFVSGPASLNA